VDRPAPPKFAFPVALTVTIGLGACIAAFAARKFTLLFVSAGSLWILALFYLYRLWWSGVPGVPGRRRTYKGIAVLVGFLIFTGAWYMIVRFDPSLK
jgi:hypothetical protein